MTTMRAYVASPETDVPQIAERPVPTPAGDQVLVRVEAVALNNADLSPASDTFVPGFEFAGEVVATGDDADANLVGTRVMGIAPAAFAEYVVAHRRHLLPVPDGVESDAAATLPTGLMTEHGAIRRAGIAASDSVLVTAATSGIAMLGIQELRALGVGTIIGTTRTPEHRESVLAAGADHVIVTSGSDLATAVRDLTDGTGVDAVLDHVGGAGLAEAIRAARQGGTVVSVGRLGGATAEIDLFELARQRVTLRSVSYGLTPPEVIGDLMDGVREQVLPAVASGAIAPPLDRTFAFEDLEEAFARLKGSAGHGKVALRLT
ncbi:zinc-binding dehydrogenase [Demequina sp. B12]|uniref:quinone oxidoreductase family protein n=1 Tax=Demequina sp. B12 TaxID=2992757 RepID=UPI00237B489C|nr:zinc-binding dehydrogenase [Demequina sp. B12]MDE0572738.1 zinc-binding dehydrogenase [Demequina sp. B12]